MISAKKASKMLKIPGAPSFQNFDLNEEFWKEVKKSGLEENASLQIDYLF